MNHIDSYGDVWQKINDYSVIRLRDKNIGSWFGGKGLWKIIITGGKPFLQEMVSVSET